MQFLVVTGLSGAGKSLAVDALEDIGWFCIDNLPAGLLPRLIEFATHSENRLEKVAVVVDIRGTQSAESMQNALRGLDASGQPYRVLFLEASSEVLQHRYKETRRVHPLCVSGGLTTAQAVEQERTILQPMYERADFIVDTTLLTRAQNRQRITSLFLASSQKPMGVTVMSFGYKYGLPQEADIVLDVRCLPNPYYVPELKAKTGMDSEVFSYVMQFDESKALLASIENFLRLSLPLYEKEGKTHLTVAVGCTGGKHRSITFARQLAAFCRDSGYQTDEQHRDFSRT